MTTSQLNNLLTKELVKFLKKEDHIDTGNLAKSISFASTVSSNGDLQLNLHTLDYIQFLDDGSFLDNFLSSNEFQDIIGEWYNDNLI